MILSALLSFLGGSAFRMVWGEIASAWTKYQDHKQEIERIKAEGEVEASRHRNDMERIKLQADLGVKEIVVQGDVEVKKLEASAFVEAMKEANKATGIYFVDCWNGSVRPAMATIALLLWVLALWRAGFVTSDWDRELVAGILGFYIADRTLAKRGK